MIRTRPAIRVALILYVLEAALLAPLHVLVDGPPAAATGGIGIGSPCATGGEPCRDPDHRHPLASSNHQADHCPACALAGRPAVASARVGLLSLPAIASAVWVSPEIRPATRVGGRHVPRGPPSSRLV